MKGIADATIAKTRNPILIIGVGRSGTTLLYDILAQHPDVAWFSNLTERFPSRARLAAVSNLYRQPVARRFGKRWLPKPVEGYGLWAHPESFGDGPLDEADATGSEIARVNRIVADHLHYQRKTRFLNKNTRNTRCMPYLDTVFDEALFVHVLRDPRAVVASLLRVAFWSDIRVWSEGGATPREWESSSGRDPVELAASLWAADVTKARDDGSALPPGRYLEIHYEELVAAPEDVLRRITAFTYLEPMPTPVGTRFESRNEKFRNQLSSSQLRLLERTVGEVAAGFGYELANPRFDPRSS